ncbi:hypothetical protein F4678DRAFT_117323 [Xylaria arbuscula]|nr:hypothetical protein F4678DRAFT_117323 [Xylaria arbuscula]
MDIDLPEPTNDRTVTPNEEPRFEQMHVDGPEPEDHEDEQMEDAKPVMGGPMDELANLMKTLEITSQYDDEPMNPDGQLPALSWICGKPPFAPLYFQVSRTSATMPMPRVYPANSHSPLAMSNISATLEVKHAAPKFAAPSFSFLEPRPSTMPAARTIPGLKGFGAFPAPRPAPFPFSAPRPSAPPAPVPAPTVPAVSGFQFVIPDIPAPASAPAPKRVPAPAPAPPTVPAASGFQFVIPNIPAPASAPAPKPAPAPIPAPAPVLAPSVPAMSGFQFVIPNIPAPASVPAPKPAPIPVPAPTVPAMSGFQFVIPSIPAPASVPAPKPAPKPAPVPVPAPTVPAMSGFQFVIPSIPAPASAPKPAVNAERQTDTAMKLDFSAPSLPSLRPAEETRVKSTSAKGPATSVFDFSAPAPAASRQPVAPVTASLAPKSSPFNFPAQLSISSAEKPPAAPITSNVFNFSVPSLPPPAAAPRTTLAAPTFPASSPFNFSAPSFPSLPVAPQATSTSANAPTGDNFQFAGNVGPNIFEMDNDELERQLIAEFEALDQETAGQQNAEYSAHVQQLDSSLFGNSAPCPPQPAAETCLSPAVSEFTELGDDALNELNELYASANVAMSANIPPLPTGLDMGIGHIPGPGPVYVDDPIDIEKAMTRKRDPNPRLAKRRAKRLF